MKDWKVLVGVALILPALLTGCGGTTADAGRDTGEGARSGAGGDGARIDGGDHGEGGIATGGRSPGSGGASGSGGVISSVEGGPTHFCPGPYVPPPTGLRTDGKTCSFTPCADIPDEELLRLYDDESAKVPNGFYYDVPGQSIAWLDGCAESSDYVRAAVRRESPASGFFDGQGETPWFYEVSLCGAGSRTRYRQYRCDFFEREVLKTVGSNPDSGRIWAGLHWFDEFYNLGGANLVCGTVEARGASHRVELCTTQTTYGDFGLCDQVRLYSTRITIEATGVVTGQESDLLRTIQGKCH